MAHDRPVVTASGAMPVAGLRERTVSRWAWLDGDGQRRIVGIDPDTGSVVIVGPLSFVDDAEPPTWATTRNGIRATLLAPGFPRDEEYADLLMEALDALRTHLAEDLACLELSLVSWMPVGDREPPSKQARAPTAKRAQT